MAIRIDGTNTTANPGITGADADTGLQFGTDEVKIVTGGTDAVTVDASQRVGIGTASPVSALNVSVADGGNVTISATNDSHTSGLAFGDTSNNASGRISYDHFSDVMRFDTAGTERMRINNLGLTTVFAATGGSSTGPLTASTAYTGQNGSRRIIIGKHSATNTGDGTICFYVDDRGNVLNTNNSYSAISDIKLKENIVDAKSQWDDIKALRVVNYNFKQETGFAGFKQLGLIAQEVEQVCPGLVGESPDRDEDGNDLNTTTKNVNYSVLYMKAVGALQEAMTRIETLETRVTQLEGGQP